MKQKQIVKYSVLLVLLVLVTLTTLELYTHRPISETVILQKQYLGNISDSCAGGCDNCLIMEVSKDGSDMTYYFAGEHKLRNDLIVGHPIHILWEYNYLVKGYRIVNIY